MERCTVSMYRTQAVTRVIEYSKLQCLITISIWDTHLFVTTGTCAFAVHKTETRAYSYNPKHCFWKRKDGDGVMMLLFWEGYPGVSSSFRTRSPNLRLFALNFIPRVSWNITVVLGINSMTLKNKLMEQNPGSVKENKPPACSWPDHWPPEV